jgi:L-methionine (R)-S-oxide reductase
MQIRIQAGKGVCADAYIKGEAVVVPDVDQYPGHLGEEFPSYDVQRLARAVTDSALAACDGDSKSEIVLPLSIPSGDGSLRKVGVFDLDATVVGTYDDADRRGLQGLLDIVVKGSDWP